MDWMWWLGMGRYVLYFIVVLSVLIFIHEFGHYLIARWAGVKVLTFSLGFGPALWRRKGPETEYRVSALPLGGYVRLLGDDPKEEISATDRHRAFLEQPVGSKMAIVAAGAVFNFLLAFVLLFLLEVTGIPRHLPEVGETLPESPAVRAGLQKNDRILAIDGRGVETWEAMTRIVERSPNRPLRLTVLREGKTIQLTATPELKSKPTLPFGEVKEVGVLGAADARAYQVVASNPLRAGINAVQQTGYFSYITIVAIEKMISGRIPAKEIGGPLRIAKMSGDAASAGYVSYLFFIALVSINLGVLNLLPIPILDGGHLLFFGIEALRGRPLSVRHREIAQQVGLFILISLMVFAFYNDVTYLIQGSAAQR